MKQLPELRLSSLSLVLISAFYGAPVFATPCSVGSFSATGSEPCELAPAGTFVAFPGATAPTPAPAGRFVPSNGATSALDAEPGSFVATSGQTASTLAPVGFFVDSFGASAPTPAPVGRFVPLTGATSALDAEPGSFVATSGQSASTLAPVGFFVDSFGASAPTPAPPGRYVPSIGSTAAIMAPVGSFVPVSGQSAPTLAPLGSYVDSVGATAAILAPIGMFVDTVGSTAATFAPVGLYVGTTGAIAPSATDAGFYSYALGASKQVSAGLVAAPMNTTIRSNQASLRAAHDLIRSGDVNQRLKASTYYQTGSVDQAGFSNGGDQSISFWGLTIVADIAGLKENAAGFFAGVTSSNYSADTNGSGNGLGFNVGAFKQVQLGAANIVGSVSYGSYSYDTTRTNLSQGTVRGGLANLQSASSDSRVNVYSASLLTEIPLHSRLPNLKGFADLAISSYQGSGYDESVSGSGLDPSAGLNVASSNYLSVPFTLGLRYDVRDAANKDGLFSLAVGYRHDFGSQQTIAFKTQSSVSYQFGTPVALSNKGAFFVSLSSANYELSNSLYLNASVSTELSNSYNFFQASVNLTKRF